MPTPKLKMCHDPACGKESPEDAESCIACGLDFAGFSSFNTWMDVRERIKAEANKPKAGSQQKRISVLDSLRGKK